jgi:hypothetical protein
LRIAISPPSAPPTAPSPATTSTSRYVAPAPTPLGQTVTPGSKHSGTAAGASAIMPTNSAVSTVIAAAALMTMLRKSRSRTYSSSVASYPVSIACLTTARRAGPAAVASIRSASTRRGS